jgi:hypothetical protein
VSYENVLGIGHWSGLIASVTDIRDKKFGLILITGALCHGQ